MKLAISQKIFEKNTQIPHFKTVLIVRAKLFHAVGRMEGKTDRRTNITNLIVAIRNFRNAPKNQPLERNKRSVGIRTTGSTRAEELPTKRAASQPSAMEE